MWAWVVNLLMQIRRGSHGRPQLRPGLSPDSTRDSACRGATAGAEGAGGSPSVVHVTPSPTPPSVLRTLILTRLACPRVVVPVPFATFVPSCN